MNAYGFLPVHPRTGLHALGIVGGNPVWPILGGDDSDDAAAQAQAAADKAAADTAAAEKAAADAKSASEKRGYPADTSVSDMTVEEQVAYWKAQSRKHENTVRARSDYDDLKTKAKERDDLVAANATEQERAVAAAKAEGRSEAMRAAGPRLVEAHFMAAAAGRLDEERVKAILEPLNADHFLTDSGDVDTAKVTTYVNGIAPVMGTGKPPAVGPSSRGQGQRNSSASPSVASGRDRYAQRHPHRSPA